jgi:AraC-like DNA-binding protein
MKPAPAPAIWHVENSAAFFAGPLQRNAPHRHSVPVYLAGLYGTFRLRVGGDRWQTCRTAMIRAGTEYEFDMAGEVLAVVYLEPNAGGAGALAPLVGDAHEVDGALLGASGETTRLRALYESTSIHDIAAALDELIAFSKRRALKGVDARIVRAVEVLQSRSAAGRPVAEVAASVGLSASRFQHLFSTGVGVPFRRYRNWHRLRRAIREVIAGANYTQAAHAAGFTDQAHFAHEFRRTFGAPASRGLAPMR